MHFSLSFDFSKPDYTQVFECSLSSFSAFGDPGNSARAKGL